MNRKFIYDKETKKATCKIWHKGISVSASAKPHKDDLDFANQMTGCQIAELKAGVKFYNKRAQERKKQIARLEAELKVLRDCVQADVATAAEIGVYLDAYVDLKENQYKEIRAMRQNPHARMTFENLGDLSENATAEQKKALESFLGKAE